MRFLKSIFFAIVTVQVLACSQSAAAQKPTTWRKQDEPSGVLPIDLVTITEPGVRHKCRVHSITDDAVVCGVGFLRKPVVYTRENVAALILPPDHSAAIATVFELVADAGLIAGSFFVPVTAVAVIMQVVGGLSPFAAITNLFDDGDHDHDIVAYQRPDATLSVVLH